LFSIPENKKGAVKAAPFFREPLSSGPYWDIAHWGKFFIKRCKTGRAAATQHMASKGLRRSRLTGSAIRSKTQTANA
jgi:hypothetical protein